MSPHIQFTRAVRDGRIASRVGGDTHGPSSQGSSYVAHQQEPNLGRNAQAFKELNAPQMRRDCYLARTGQCWIAAALAAAILAFIAGGGAHKIIGNVSLAFEQDESPRP